VQQASQLKGAARSQAGKVQLQMKADRADVAVAALFNCPTLGQQGPPWHTLHDAGLLRCLHASHAVLWQRASMCESPSRCTSAAWPTGQVGTGQAATIITARPALRDNSSIGGCHPF
jgi:hypothetical protein